MRDFGPCLCGDPYCKRCFPGGVETCVEDHLCDPVSCAVCGRDTCSVCSPEADENSGTCASCILDRDLGEKR